LLLSLCAQEHIAQGVEILRGFLEAVKKKHPEWTQHEQEQGGIAANNFGVKNVRTKKCH